MKGFLTHLIGGPYFYLLPLLQIFFLHLNWSVFLFVMIRHPFHLVDFSPWPITGSLGALSLTVGLVRWFHGYGTTPIIIGLSLILFTIYQWWRDVVREGTIIGLHTSFVTFGLRWGMILFIISEVIFFRLFLGLLSQEPCSNPRNWLCLTSTRTRYHPLPIGSPSQYYRAPCIWGSSYVGTSCHSRKHQAHCNYILNHRSLSGPIFYIPSSLRIPRSLILHCR